jgi:hypothetical protein
MVVFAQDDIKQSPSCKYYGMDRQKFDFSRMLIFLLISSSLHLRYKFQMISFAASV